MLHAGVVALVRTSENSNSCVDYRIAQDGAHLVAPFMRKRKVPCDAADFAQLLQGGQIDFTQLSEQLVAHLEPLDPGSVVCVLGGHTQGANTPLPPSIVHSLDVPVSRIRILFNPPSWGVLPQSLTLSLSTRCWCVMPRAIHHNAHHSFTTQVVWRGLSTSVKIFCSTVDLTAIKARVDALREP